MRRSDQIKVDIHVIGKTGLLLATSEELRGLYVHGRNNDELWERIPVAIRAILDADRSKGLDLA
jgi:hypothetical protein